MPNANPIVRNLGIVKMTRTCSQVSASIRYDFANSGLGHFHYDLRSLIGLSIRYKTNAVLSLESMKLDFLLVGIVAIHNTIFFLPT